MVDAAARGFADRGYAHIASEADALGAEAAALVAAIEAHAAPSRVFVGADGWAVVLADGPTTKAAETLCRIGGVLDEAPVSDLRLAIQKMDGAEIALSAIAVEAIALALGAEIHSGAARFDGDEFPYIEPTRLEIDVHYEMEGMQFRAALPSTLAKRLGMDSGRTTVSALLDTMPFVLRSSGKGPIRLLGAPADVQLPGMGAFIGVESSRCGSRAAVKYTISSEMICSNSVNIGKGVGETLSGAYVNLDTEIKVTIPGPDAQTRNVGGFGRLVRTQFPDFATGQTAILLLDRNDMTAVMHVVDALEERRESDIVADFLQGPLPTVDELGSSATPDADVEVEAFRAAIM